MKNADRTFYQSDKDLSNEARIAERIAEAWGCKMQKLPHFYSQDYSAINDDGVVRALVEIKCRSKAVTQVDNMIINLNKWLNLCRLTTTTSAKGILVAEFKGEIFWIVANPNPEYKITIGWTNRADPNDYEPIVNIPIKDMKPLKKRTEIPSAD